MRIFNVPPAEALWSLVSSLADKIPVYKEVMDEDENSVPESYLLLRTDVGTGDSGSIYGDGEAHLRQTECDIVLVSKSKGANTDDIHNQNKAKVKKLLQVSGVTFYGTNLGYDETLKSSRYTWSVRIVYG